MEDEIYIYNGSEYSRNELENEYGDRLDEAIQKFGFKKKDKTISPDSTEPSEIPLVDTEDFTINRTATDIVRTIEDSYEKAERYKSFLDQYGLQDSESLKDFDYKESDFFGLSPAAASRVKQNKKLAEETFIYGDDTELYANTDIRRQADKINEEYKFISGGEGDLINVNERDNTLTFDVERYADVMSKSEKFYQQSKSIEERERQLIDDMPDFIVDDIVAATRSLGRAAIDLPANLYSFIDPEYISDRQIKNQFKTIGAKKGVGLSQEQIDKGYSKLLEEGDLSGAYTAFVIDGAAQLPQVAVGLAVTMATRNPKLGRRVAGALLGSSAAGAKYAEMYSDPTMSHAGKVLSSIAVGAAEGVSEAVFASDIIGMQRLYRRLGVEGVKRNMPRGILAQAKNYGLPFAKGVAEEALEEGLAQSFETFVIDHIVRGEEFNPYNISDAMIMGAMMGGGVTSATLLPSYIGSYKTAKRRAEIANEIKEINSTINSAQLTETERKMADDKIFNLRKEANDLRKEDAILYKDMSREDTEEVIRLNSPVPV